MIRNEICPECGHHMLSHVLIGERGNGCQELVGDYEYGACGCLHYEIELSKPLIETELTYEEWKLWELDS